MKLLLKLVFFGVAILFMLNCSGNRDKNIKEKPLSPSLRQEGSGTGANIVSTRRYRESINEPALRDEALFREIRNNDQPPDMEEIRRQRNIERTANIEWLKASTMKYSPDSWYLLMQYDSLPASSTASTVKGGVGSSQKTAEAFDYLRGRTRIDLLASMEKNVHEIAHGYFEQNVYRYIRKNNLQMNTDNAEGYIYISPSRSFFVSFPLRAMFPSSELTVIIPADLRTYRFDTYIEGTTSTQGEGVIGLLNELHAYYCGSRYCFDMLEAYKTAAGSDAAGLFEWVTHTQSTMSAFYEFDFFIREYLLYMKKKYPANYEMLRSYRPFTEAYGSLRLLYKELIDKYMDRIHDEMSLLNSSGEAAVRSVKGWLWVESGNSHISSGTPVLSEDTETLIPVLESRRYRKIEGDFPYR